MHGTYKYAAPLLSLSVVSKHQLLTFVLPSDPFLELLKQVGAHSGEMIQKAPSWNIKSISISLSFYIL